MTGALPLVPYPRAVRRLSGAALRVPAAGAAASGPVLAEPSKTAALPEAVRRVLTARRAEGRGPEAYRLHVDADGITLEGGDAAALTHGIRTLAQLAVREGDEWVVPAVEIEDAPRFAYRGLLLDVARHFFGVATVCRVIDAAAALKLNVLHLHLSDDQGWRLALASRPELAERSTASAVGGDPGGCYTASDYRAILAHAASRHVTVVPEFDGPGHTHAVGLAYPELVAEPVITAEVRETVETFGGGLPTPGEPYTGLAVGFSSLRIGTPEVDAFVTDVFTELAASTPGPYVHVGGDEALGTPTEAYASYVREATGLVRSLGKIPIAWHEASSAAVEGTVAQYWGFTAPVDPRLTEFVRGGGRVILSPADAVYLDMKPDADSPLGLVWANGPTSLEDAYSWDPSRMGLSDTDVLGVETALWTETVRTETDIAALLFPPLLAVAELAWSPASARSWPEFADRAAALPHPPALLPHPAEPPGNAADPAAQRRVLAARQGMEEPA